MKISYLFVIVALVLVSCQEAPQQDNSATEESTTEQTNETTEQTPSGLKQQGDYSSLFNSPDCKVITAEEISTALGIAITDRGIKGVCSFESKFSDNRTWYLSITRNEMSKSDIQREVDSFKSDETGQLAVQTSETGDTYFCIQHLQGYLSIYNPNYDGSISIGYGSIGASRGFSKEERLEHQELAVKLANALLKKHQQ